MNEEVPPYIKSVRWVKRHTSLEVRLYSDLLLTIPLRVLEDVLQVSLEKSEQGGEKTRWALMATNPVRVLEDGLTIEIDTLNWKLYVPDLFMSQELRDSVIRNWASTIGSKKTPAKAESSRKNGRKGGRPTILRDA